MILLNNYTPGVCLINGRHTDYYLLLSAMVITLPIYFSSQIQPRLRLTDSLKILGEGFMSDLVFSEGNKILNFIPTAALSQSSNLELNKIAREKEMNI